MDRKSSNCSDRATACQIPPPYLPSSPLPPWENRNLSQVPYLAPSSPPATTQRDRRPPWSPGARSQPNIRPRLAKTASAPCASGCSSQASVDNKRSAWRPDNQTNSVSPPPPIPQYESLLNYPIEPRSIGQHSASTFHLPPSPPEYQPSSIRSGSPPPNQIKALPGTMSARSNDTGAISRMRAESAPVSQPDPEPAPKARRFRSALKEMFKRDPVDEDQFERIADKHWADE